eukprot:GEMP01018652.1.p1 GENE.GEMP01018652.1~~GEMP01018652.1.p1  ORF type:complete len:541 (+),score=111.28 GEMP01018652.1:142-1764(+)
MKHHQPPESDPRKKQPIDDTIPIPHFPLPSCPPTSPVSSAVIEELRIADGMNIVKPSSLVVDSNSDHDDRATTSKRRLARAAYYLMHCSLLGTLPLRCWSDCASFNGLNTLRNVYVFGDGVYTAHSHICPAARHAGVLPDGGGNVEYRMLPGLSHYGPLVDSGIIAIERHNITSFPIGAFPKAIEFRRAAHSYPTYVETAFIAVVFLLTTYTFLAPPSTIALHSTPKEYFLFVVLNGYLFIRLFLCMTDPVPDLICASGEIFVIAAFALALYANNLHKVFASSRRTHRVAFLLAFVLTWRFGEAAGVLFPNITFSRGGFDAAITALHIVAFVISSVFVIAPLAVAYCVDHWRLRGFRTAATLIGSRACLLGIIVLVGSVRGLLEPEYNVHIHHNFIGLIVASMVAVPTIGSNVVAGLGVGLFVEGVTIWEWKPNFDLVMSRDAYDDDILQAAQRPTLHPSVEFWRGNGYVQFSGPVDEGASVAVFVNDVIRYEGPAYPPPEILAHALTNGTWNYLHAQYRAPGSRMSSRPWFMVQFDDEE